jgi:hypothetical protein
MIEAQEDSENVLTLLHWDRDSRKKEASISDQQFL